MMRMIVGKEDIFEALEQLEEQGYTWINSGAAPTSYILKFYEAEYVSICLTDEGHISFHRIWDSDVKTIEDAILYEKQLSPSLIVEAFCREMPDISISEVLV